MKLTIGMATYQDFEGIWAAVQALRLYQDLADCEILVIDNADNQATAHFCAGAAGVRREVYTEIQGTAAPRNEVFARAQGGAVLCMDSHVMLAPGAVARLVAWYDAHPGTLDLFQGPLLYDDGHNVGSGWRDSWGSDGMWGEWAQDARADDPEGEPFPIWGQGLGIFSCRREAWLGFNPLFRGFGGEEGYIHEKFRRAGRTCWCLPWLRWSHRFGRTASIPFAVTLEDRYRNYVLGLTELGIPLKALEANYDGRLPPAVRAEIRAAVTPKVDTATCGWRAAAQALDALTPADQQALCRTVLRRFEPAGTRRPRPSKRPPPMQPGTTPEPATLEGALG